MTDQAKLFLMSGAVSGLIAVALGAFGSLGLEDKLSADLIEIYQTGNLYHFYHSFALLAVGLVALHARGKPLAASGWCFILGIFFFSGSLYALALSGVRTLGAITPIGGLFLMAGWALLATVTYSATTTSADR